MLRYDLSGLDLENHFEETGDGVAWVDSRVSIEVQFKFSKEKDNRDKSLSCVDT